MHVKTFEWIQTQYVNVVENFINDPEECACDGKDYSHAKDDVVNYFNYLVEIGKDIGVDFWEAVKQGAFNLSIISISVKDFCKEYAINPPQWL